MQIVIECQMLNILLYAKKNLKEHSMKLFKKFLTALLAVMTVFCFATFAACDFSQNAPPPRDKKLPAVKRAERPVAKQAARLAARPAGERGGGTNRKTTKS